MNIIEVEIEVEKPVENVDDDEGGRKSPARHNVYETDTISGLQVGRQSALQYRTQYKLWVSSLGEINTVMCYSIASYHMVTVSCKCRSLMPSYIYKINLTFFLRNGSYTFKGTMVSPTEHRV